SVSPLATEASYSPWATAAPPLPRPKTAAVFFGVGRDSTATACLLAEVYGPEEVLLFQFVHPLRSKAREAAHLERRQEALMLGPARERLGGEKQVVWREHP